MLSNEDLELIKFIALRCRSLFKKDEIHKTPNFAFLDLYTLGAKLVRYYAFNCQCIDLNKLYALVEDEFIEVMSFIVNLEVEVINDSAA